jgi:hypothetical protein
MYIAIHVETTGLGEGASPVLFSGVAFDGLGNVLNEYTCLLKPYDHAEWESGAVESVKVDKAIADAYGYEYKSVSGGLQSWIDQYIPVVSGTHRTEIAMGRMGLRLNPYHFDTEQLYSYLLTRGGIGHDRKFACGINSAVNMLNIPIGDGVFTQNGATIFKRNMGLKIYQVFMELLRRKM